MNNKKTKYNNINKNNENNENTKKKRVSSLSILLVILVLFFIIYIIVKLVNRKGLKDIIPTMDEQVEENIEEEQEIEEKDKRLDIDFSKKEVEKVLESSDKKFTTKILKDGTITVKVNRYDYLENAASKEDKKMYEEIFEHIKKERPFSILNKNIIDILYPVYNESNTFYESRERIVVKCSDLSYYFVDVTSTSSEEYNPMSYVISELKGKDIKEYRITNNGDTFITSNNDEINIDL